MFPKKQVAGFRRCSFGHSDAFECHVMQANTQADPWKQVRVGIYVVDSAVYDK